MLSLFQILTSQDAEKKYMQKKRNIFRHCLNHKNLRSCDNGNLSKLIQIYHERAFDINFDVGI